MYVHITDIVQNILHLDNKIVDLNSTLGIK